MQRLGRLASQRITFASSRSYGFTALEAGRAARLASKPLSSPAKKTARLFSMSSSTQAPPNEAGPSASAEAPEAPAPVTSTHEGEDGNGGDKPKAGKTEAQPPSGPSSGNIPEPDLPPLTQQEFRTYNRLAEQMDYFHDHFRRSWKLLYDACTSGKRPSNMTLKQFLEEGLSLIRYLEAHHSIEETYLFPLLARKMPEFRAGKGGGAGELVRQHRLIHAGMDGLEDYLRRCRNRESELELSVMRSKMDSWGDVLLSHLDQEVRTLGAENMRRHWTPEEMRAIPI